MKLLGYISAKIIIISASLLTLLFFSSSQPSFSQKIYLVNSVGDHEDVDLSDEICADHEGNCTLRAAIQNANKSILRDEIYFELPDEKVHFILLNKSLPPIIYPILIDGKNGYNRERLRVNIFLDGKNLNNEDKLYYLNHHWQKPGLHLSSKSHKSTIRGIGFISFYSYALLVDTDGNTIQGNEFGYFEHDPKKENLYGVFVLGNENLIGGTIDNERNHFIYNFQGIALIGHNNSVIGNYIGVKNDGISPAGNHTGIGSAFGSKNNLIRDNIISSNFLGIKNSGSGFQFLNNKIGTDASGSINLGNYVGLNINSYGRNTKIGAIDLGNLISGNEIGILIRPQSWAEMDLDKFSDIDIISNKIGTDISGNFPIGNKKGIIIKNVGGITIGGTDEARNNLISGNTQAGIEMVDVFDVIIQKNIIGLDINQMNPIPNFYGIYLRDTENIALTKNNTITQNLIGGNFASGIYIGKGWSNLGVFSNLMGVTKFLPIKLPNANHDILSFEIDKEHCIGGASNELKNILNLGISQIKEENQKYFEWKNQQANHNFLMSLSTQYVLENKKLEIPPLLRIENLFYREAIKFYTFQLMMEEDKFIHDYYLRLSSKIVED